MTLTTRSARRAARALVLVASLAACALLARAATPTRAATPAHSATPARVRTARPPAPLRVLVLGDAYTAAPALAPSERWPYRLVASLRAHGRTVAPPVVIAGVGWGTAELADTLGLQPFTGKFDLVALQVGARNQFRGEALEDFQTEFAVLLSQAVDYAAGNPTHVVVLSLPDWGATPFGRASGAKDVSDQIDVFNAAARARTALVGARWVDVTTLGRAHADEPGFLAPDSLHPSATALIEWARAVEETLAASAAAPRATPSAGAGR